MLLYHSLITAVHNATDVLILYNVIISLKKRGAGVCDTYGVYRMIDLNLKGKMYELSNHSKNSHLVIVRISDYKLKNCQAFVEPTMHAWNIFL